MTEVKQFQYDPKFNFESNFTTWLQDTNEERFKWREEPLNEEEAYDVFVQQYGHHKVT
jgi:hypothetical protein